MFVTVDVPINLAGWWQASCGWGYEIDIFLSVIFLFCHSDKTPILCITRIAKTFVTQACMLLEVSSFHWYSQHIEMRICKTSAIYNLQRMINVLFYTYENTKYSILGTLIDPRVLGAGFPLYNSWFITGLLITWYRSGKVRKWTNYFRV